MIDTPAPNGPAIGRQFNFNTVAAVIFIVLAVVLFFIIPDQIDEPLIKIGNQNKLSPELFPRMVAAGFFLLGIWLFFKSFSVRQHNELRDLDREAITNVVVTLAIMAGYVFLMVNVGFVIGSAVMIMVMSTYFGNRNYGLGAAVSIIVPTIVFVLFTKVLVTSLPPFPLDDVLSSDSFLYGPLNYLSNHSIF